MVHSERVSLLKQQFSHPIVITNPNSLHFYMNYCTPGTSFAALVLDSSTRTFVVRDLESTNFKDEQLDISVVTYQEEDPINIVASLLSGQETVGIEAAYLSAKHREQLERCMSLHGARVKCVDLSEFTTSARVLKNSWEIDCMRRAAEYVYRGYTEALHDVHVGMLETELAGAIVMRKMGAGSEWASYPEFVAFGRQGYLGHHPASSRVRLQDGEIVFMEIGASDHRYHAARMHTVFMGAPPAWFVRFERSIREAVHTARTLCKPGVPARSIDHAMRTIVERTFDNTAVRCPHKYQMSRRSGYSIGVGTSMDWADDGFFINPSCDFIIEQGMTFHLIPWVKLEGVGAIGFSDVVHVGERHAASLFPAPMLSQLPHCVYSLSQVPRHRMINTAVCNQYAETDEKHATPMLDISYGGIPVYAKDERRRSGSRSFKICGVEYAVTELIKREQLKSGDVVATMSDGNHGESLAMVARKYGMRCVVLLPKNVEERKEVIESLGASVDVVDGSYDDCIERLKLHAELHDWKIISDTSWSGYETIPRYIMHGYTQIFKEVLAVTTPTHVFIQTGVGGLLAAACIALPSCTRIICVEPADAACVYENMLMGNESSNLEYCSGTTNSVMRGLNCGIPSMVCYPIIQDRVNDFLVIGDDWAHKSMSHLAGSDIHTNASGAAGFAGFMAAHEKRFEINSASRVVVLITEASH